MGQDQWESSRFARANVQKMDSGTVDLCGELRKLVELCFLLAPVVLLEPIVGQVFQVGKGHTPAPADTWYLFGPTGARNPVSQIIQIRLRDVDTKRSSHAVSSNSQLLPS